MIENQIVSLKFPERKTEPCIFSPKSERSKFISSLGDENNTKCFCCEKIDYLGCEIYNKRISSAQIINLNDYIIKS